MKRSGARDLPNNAASEVEFEYRNFMLLKIENNKVDVVMQFQHPFYRSFTEPDTYGVI